MSTTFSTFEVLASEDASEHERVAGTRAVIAAQTRATNAFGAFVSKAPVGEGRNARIELISTDLESMLAEISAEYGYEDTDRLNKAATVALGGGHAADCGCGFCENKGSFGKDDDKDKDKDGDSKDDKKSDAADDDKKDDDDKDDKSESKKPWESSVSYPTGSVAIRHTASAYDWEHISADVETGDSYASETIDLGESKDGVSDVGSPKIDKGKVPAGGLSAIDVPSKRNNLEHQDATDRADYTAGDFDPQNGVTDRIDADTALQPEHNVADDTQTWTGTEGQADPVTSAVLAKWSVVTK